MELWNGQKECPRKCPVGKVSDGETMEVQLVHSQHCEVWLGSSVSSQGFEAVFPVPTYIDFLCTIDLSKLQMQSLQWMREIPDSTLLSYSNYTISLPYHTSRFLKALFIMLPSQSKKNHDIFIRLLRAHSNATSSCQFCHACGNIASIPSDSSILSLHLFLGVFRSLRRVSILSKNFSLIFLVHIELGGWWLFRVYEYFGVVIL